MTETMTEAAPLTISSTAIVQLKKLREDQQVPEDHGLRVGVKGGGCSGFSYILGFDTATDEDMVFYVDDITVYLNKAHALYLMGMNIDWLDGLQNRGFTFTNPNAKSTCGCGSSFSA